MKRLRAVLIGAVSLGWTMTSAALPAGEVTVKLSAPTPPPAWALLQRELLRANARACREYFAHYFDERGYLKCVVRWGGIDGPDDAIEAVGDWPLLHALGAADDVLQMYEEAWEGHLRQYTDAKTVQVEYARDGMYYKEFPVHLDWTHLGEGLSVFYQHALSEPNDSALLRRARRFAGFYLNEDPSAPNYDPQHQIIRSMYNGSRGPLLRKANPLDWAGDPIRIAGRFVSLHGERTWDEMVAHVKDYTDVVGDHPQNLAATSLPTLAYMLTHDPKYREWVHEYVGAWRQRMEENGGIIPTNIGLDGTLGGEADGKWYGGVYGWGFSVVVPQTGEQAHRNTHYLGLVGFGNALLLTGDWRNVDAWRRQINTVNAQSRIVDGQRRYPHMYGDQGWYAYSAAPYSDGALEVYYWSMKPEDRRQVPANAWLDYLDGGNPEYPERALQSDLERVRRQNTFVRRAHPGPE